MKRRFRIFQILLIFVLLAAVTSYPAAAQQNDGLTLGLRKNFGFNAGNRIQGSFTMRISGPEDLERVEFFIDGELVGEDSEAPFTFAFDTGAFEYGMHILQATGYTSDGRELQSNQIQANFVTAEEGYQVAMRIVIPLLIVVFGAMGISFIIPFITGRGKKTDIPLGTEQNYGVAGGAICPRCGRPFPLRLLAPNLGLRTRFDRCPHCGKWAAHRRRSLAELRAAEAAERQAVREQPASTMSAEERLRQELEASRYQDM